MWRVVRRGWLDPDGAAVGDGEGRVANMGRTEGWRRAITDAQKQQRRSALLAVAWRAFQDTPYGAITIARLAEQAGLAKGALYLYFHTKEELFLAVLERELDGWFEAVEAQACSATQRWTPGEAALVLCRGVEERPALVRLLGMLQPVLEPHVEPSTLLQFKRRLDDWLVRVGEALEARLSFLAAGQGARLLLRFYALVLGLQQLTTLPDAVVDGLGAGQRERLTITFERELTETMRALLTGLAVGDSM